MDMSDRGQFTGHKEMFGWLHDSQSNDFRANGILAFIFRRTMMLYEIKYKEAKCQIARKTNHQINTKMPKCQNAKMSKCQNAKMSKCQNAKCQNGSRKHYQMTKMTKMTNDK
jgi:hypothetical protein